MSAQLFEIEMPWGMKPTPEQVAVLEKIKGEKVQFETDGKTLAWHSRSITATLEEVMPLMPVEVKKALPYSRLASVAEQVVAAVAARPDAVAPVNERCNVVVAGNGMLLAVDAVKVEKDFCTDALQHELNSGWRILAICVQPDQRRPDYVLGKIGGVK